MPADALAELGYATTLVGNATHALEELAADADRFDVVFSDVVMPGMTGIELAQEIRRRYPDLPVVLTSGYSHVLSENGSTGSSCCKSPIRSSSSRACCTRSAAAAGKSARRDARRRVNSAHDAHRGTRREPFDFPGVIAAMAKSRQSEVPKSPAKKSDPRTKPLEKSATKIEIVEVAAEDGDPVEPPPPEVVEPDPE